MGNDNLSQVNNIKGVKSINMVSVNQKHRPTRDAEYLSLYYLTKQI